MIVALLPLLFPPSAHAGRRHTPPDAVEDALAFAELDRAKAITVLEEALADASSRDVPMLALHLAEQRRLTGDAVEARRNFTIAQTEGDRHFQDAAQVGLVLLEADRGVDQRGLAQLRGASEKVLPRTLDADRHLMLAVHAARSNDAAATERHSRAALQLAAADADVRSRIDATLEKLKNSGDADVDVVLTPTSSSTLDRARDALAKGDRARAAELARRALGELDAESFEALQAKYLERRAATDVPVDPGKVAVLLPLSGRYEGAGKQFQRAIELGYERAGGRARLVFHDSGADPDEALATLERAVLDEGAIAVAGPLLGDVTDVMVRAAAALEVPLVSLSQSNESREHAWVLQGVPSIGDQTEALAEHVMRVEQMQRFAIFAPDSSYGHRAAESFRASVEARGGAITEEVFYDPTATSLMEFAAKMGQKQDPERRWELTKLRKAATEAGRDPGKVVLPPIVDFDAIFIPDNASNIPIATSALAYEEFAIGEFKPRPKEDPVPLLGLSGWNRPSLVGAGGEYVRNARFTDASIDAAFLERYREQAGRTPSLLEAVLYEAGRMLGAATKAGATDRAGFLDALTEVQLSAEATGATGFAEGRVDTPLQVLTIDREGIRPLARDAE